MIYCKNFGKCHSVLGTTIILKNPKKKQKKKQRGKKSQKCLFIKMNDRKVKQVLSGGWYQWEGGGYKERV
jgi:hypothetical protein